MNAICLVIDRLHAGYLGAYGSSWIETPELDRLAAESFLLDQAVIDTPNLETLYRSFWQGQHALAPAQPEDRPTLMGLLSDAGVQSTLLTDEQRVAAHPLAWHFDELLQIDPPWQPRVADLIDETHLARCFAQSVDWLHNAHGPFLLWCHLGALGTSWDAPTDYRRAYWEPGDPEPSSSAEVPDRFLPEDFDPDEVWAVAQVYAGQVSLLDACIGALLEFLHSSPVGSETLLVLTSARGFPLGEHRRIGPCDEALYGELVHVPWLMRFPDKWGAAVRSAALVEPSDLWATLLDWWRVAQSPPSPTAFSLLPLVREDVLSLRDRVCAGEGRERAIRTPAWFLRATEKPGLFAKPDDRWEVNDVSVRCPEVVETLLATLDQYERMLPAGCLADLPPLNDVLLCGLE